MKKIATVLAAGSLLLGAVAAAPAASATTPTTSAAATFDASGPTAGLRTSLVAAWYEDFLGRSSAGDAGAQYWIARLRTQAPEAVLADLLGTPEFVGAQIDGYYTGYLGRGIEGDPAADYWFSGVYQDRFPLEWVQQNVLASDEYAAFTSAADPGRRAQLVVAQWYRDVLGREAGAGEVEYWSIQFEDQDPLFLLREIWYSPEAVGGRVASHYEDYLRRPASSSEVAYWSAAEVTSDVGVVIAIASSAEYQQNALTKGTAG